MFLILASGVASVFFEYTCKLFADFGLRTFVEIFFSSSSEKPMAVQTLPNDIVTKKGEKINL